MPTARLPEVLARFARLGLTSFGGPVAHLGYFRREFVERAKWLDDAAYAELVAICSVLPGPTSSQVGMALGAMRAGPLGALGAWLTFTLPSALVLAVLAGLLRANEDAHIANPAVAAPLADSAVFGGLAGLEGAAAAVVLLAVVQLAQRLATTTLSRIIAAGAFALAFGIGRVAPQFMWVVLVAGGVAGALLLHSADLPSSNLRIGLSPRTGLTALLLLVALLFALPLAATPGSLLDLFAQCFRAGALVFGGGHAVLPLLQGIAKADAISTRDFLAGYGAAQSVPGPLFTFSAFLGEIARSPAGGPLGALVAVLGIFSPSFLLLTAALPLWKALREVPRAPATLAGINAAVVGLLAAVFIDPIALAVLPNPLAAAIALLAFAAFVFRDVPAWLVVLACGALGAGFGFVLNHSR